MQKSQALIRANEAAARDALLFEVAPVSMWIEDASALLALFKEWSVQGVTSFHDHILAHPALRLERSLAVRVDRVNAKTLAQFEAFPDMRPIGRWPWSRSTTSPKANWPRSGCATSAPMTR